MPLRRKGLDSQGLGSKKRDKSRVRKRVTLKEDSSLRSEKINISEVNLSQLLDRKSFTILYILSCNRYRVKTTALADSRANVFTLLNTKCIQKLSEFLNQFFKTLEQSVSVKEYNRQVGKPITTVLRTYLQIDKQQQYNVSFLVTDLGYYYIILGQKQLSYLNLQLNIQNCQLIWPATLLLMPSLVKQITVSIENLFGTVINISYQADIA